MALAEWENIYENVIKCVFSHIFWEGLVPHLQLWIEFLTLKMDGDSRPFIRPKMVGSSAPSVLRIRADPLLKQWFRGGGLPSGELT